MTGGPGSAGRLARSLCLAALCLAAVAPILVVPYPPCYDYYHWVFEGKLLSRIAFGSPAERAEIFRSYDPVLAPVPNQASAWGLAVLCRLAPPLVAGRIFLAGSVLLFGLGFAFLVRSVQRRPTVAEALGFPWATGFFLYKGYLSYLVSVGLLFLAVGFVIRLRRSEAYPPRGLRWLALSAIAAGLFLAHIIGWGIFAAVVAVDVVTLVRQKRVREAGRLAAAFLPSFGMLAWYALVAPGEHSIDYYFFVSDKLRSLIGPLQFFLRLDPLRPVLPVFELNVLMLLVMAAAIASAVDWRAGLPRSRRLLAASGGLAAVAVGLPLAALGDMLRPDERLVLPAFLLALAALPAKPWTLPRGLLVAAAIAPILLLHVGEYRSASREFASMQRALSEVIPPGVPVLSIGLRPPSTGTGCQTEGHTTIGLLASKWIGIVRLLEDGGIRVNLMPTSVVVRRESTSGEDDLHATSRTREELPELAETAGSYAERYDYVIFLGCSSDIREAELAFGSSFTELRAGAGFALLGPKSLAESPVD